MKQYSSEVISNVKPVGVAQSQTIRELNQTLNRFTNLLTNQKTLKFKFRSLEVAVLWQPICQPHYRHVRVSIGMLAAGFSAER